ncbi:MAG: flagella synthesis protein FlgN [Pseudomonadales bacterium]
MSQFEPSQFRSALTNLLSSQQNLLGELETLIALERDALNQKQSETLFKLAAEKEDLMGNLEQFLTQSKTVVDHLRQQMPDASTRDIFNWCDPSGALDQLRLEVMTLTDRCVADNQHNGIQVRRQAQQVHRALSTLRGEDLQGFSYGSKGENFQGHDSRSLGKA